MTLAVSFYEQIGPGGMARAREVFRQHSAYADEFRASGDLLMIGTFADPVGDGSMAVFHNRDAAERFVAGDPFVTEGVVVGWRILDWNAEEAQTREIDPYKLVLASSVGSRDGMALELAEPNGERVAEVFQNDETGQRTVTFYTSAPVPVAAVEALLARARSEL